MTKVSHLRCAATVLAVARRMPAEWAPHEHTLMAWPCRAELWADHLDEAEHDVATIAVAIAELEPVTMIARPADAERAAARCGPKVDIVELPLDDSWVRDTGPMYVFDGSRRVAVDATFNAWGHKFEPYGDDAALVERWCDRTGDERRPLDLVLEGGAITVDGEGTLLTTESCLLHPNRNPSLSRTEIERRLTHGLGAMRVVWVPSGLDDRDTDGHVDTVACFARPGLVLVQGCDDPRWRDADRVAITRRCIDGALDAAGRRLEVLDVPVLPVVDVDGEQYAVPYLNLYVCNGGVVVPVTSHPADADALAIIGAAFPGRRVIGVPGRILAYGGGGPHCITMQVPAA